MRFEVGQKRTALAARNLSLVLFAFTVGLVAIAAGIAAYSADEMTPRESNSSASTPNGHSSSSSSSPLGSSSSSVSFSGSSSAATIQSSAVQQYPIEWAQNSPSVCDDWGDLGCCDFARFCISAPLIFRNGTGFTVEVTAFVQDTVTGKNTTLSNTCYYGWVTPPECQVGSRDLPAGDTYKVTVLVTTKDQKSLLAPPRTITVSYNASTTSTSTAFGLSACGGPLDTLLNPAPKGTVYVKVVTDQGVLITNGSLLVTQVGNYTWNYNGSWPGWGLRAHYCISLGDVNGTGYLQLGENRIFLTSGYYNVTLLAGYNQGPGYISTIPSIQVHPNSTIYVTVSIPSGEVTVVTSNEGSSAVTTTTTSATTIKNGG